MESLIHIYIPPSNIIYLIVLLKFNFWVACQLTNRSTALTRTSIDAPLAFAHYIINSACIMSLLVDHAGKSFVCSQQSIAWYLAEIQSWKKEKTQL